MEASERDRVVLIKPRKAADMLGITDTRKLASLGLKPVTFPTARGTQRPIRRYLLSEVEALVAKRAAEAAGKT